MVKINQIFNKGFFMKVITGFEEFAEIMSGASIDVVKHKVMNLDKEDIFEIVILGKANCPFCEKAKMKVKFLQDKGVLENAIYCDVLNIGVDREDIIHIMSESLNKPVKTLPQILLKPSQGDIYYLVGGYTDLEALLA